MYMEIATKMMESRKGIRQPQALNFSMLAVWSGSSAYRVTRMAPRLMSRPSGGDRLDPGGKIALAIGGGMFRDDRWRRRRILHPAPGPAECEGAGRSAVRRYRWLHSRGRCRWQRWKLPMMVRVSEKVYLRPTRSPNRPKINAPQTGVAIKPAAKVARV